MSIGGVICLGAFILWTLFSLIVYSAHENVYRFMQSTWCIIIVIVYVIILTFFSIGKRMAKKYE